MLRRLSIITMLVLALAATSVAAPSAWASGTVKITGDDGTFTAYRLFTGDVSGDKFSNAKFDETTASASIWKDIAGRDFAGAADVIAWLTEQVADSPSATANKVGEAFDAAGKGTTFSHDETVTLEDGYYVITGSRKPIPIMTLVGDGSNLDTLVKPPAPQITKESDCDETEVGAEIGYTITVTLPADYSEYEEYYFDLEDEAQGVKVVKDTMEVFYSYRDGVPEKVTDVFTITVNGSAFSIVTQDLKQAIPDAQPGAKITVTYKAVLDTDAFTTGAGSPNTNTVWLEYSSVPRTNQHATTPKKEADVLTYAFAFTKLGNGAALADAEFIICDEDGKYWDGSGWAAEKENAAKIVSGADGTFKVSGIKAGTYTIAEVKAPYGFTTIEDTQIKVVSKKGEDGKFDLTATCESEAVKVVGVDATSGVISIEITDAQDEGQAAEPQVNPPTNTPQEPSPSNALINNLSKLGDMAIPIIAIVIACAAGAIVVIARKRSKRE